MTPGIGRDKRIAHPMIHFCEYAAICLSVYDYFSYYTHLRALSSLLR